MIKIVTPKYMAVYQSLSNKTAGPAGRWLLPFLSLIALIILPVLAPPSVSAEDYLVGTVIAVEPEAGEFTLQVAVGEDGEPQVVTIQLVTSEGEPSLPNNVQVGEQIRAWGAYSSQGDLVFEAETVRGSGSQMKDRSGVRSRLSRGGHVGSGMQRGQNGRGNRN